MFFSRTLLASSLLILVFSALAASEPQSWRTIQLRHPALDVASSASSLWVCGADEMIAKSSDRGQTWEIKHETPSGSVLLSMGFANDQLGYATGTNGLLLVTPDGGTDWKPIKVGNDPIYHAAFADEKHGLIHTAATVEFTNDGGATWTPIPTLQSDPELQKFKYVLSLAALDTDHMAVLLKEGPAQYYDQRIVATQDGGKTFKTINIPDVGLIELTTHAGEYWAFGHEVIEKEKKGGGYGVALAMHSSDAEKWEHSPRPEREFDNCTSDGCLMWDGVGANPFAPKTTYWTYPSGKVITPKWAMTGDSLCTISGHLSCTTVARTETLPSRPDDSAVPPMMTPPALGAPKPSGLVCISCPYEHVIVSDKPSGIAVIELKLLVATDGTVSTVDVSKAPTPEIGARFALAARSWVFEPLTKDGVPAQVRTVTTLSIHVIKPH
jgi:hypothetical protein